MDEQDLIKKFETANELFRSIDEERRQIYEAHSGEVLFEWAGFLYPDVLRLNFVTAPIKYGKAIVELASGLPSAIATKIATKVKGEQ